MGLEGPQNFIPAEKISSPENEPVSKDALVEMLKIKGVQDAEAIAILEKFTMEREAQFRQEGRNDASMESLREKAHALRLADCFIEAISVMHDVADIAQNEGDTESYEEAMRIIKDRLAPLLLKKQNPVRVVHGNFDGKISEAKKMTLAESGERVSREQVLDAYKKLALARKGTDPADLDSNDTEVAEAQKLEERWDVQQDVEAQDDDARQRHSFEKTMLFVDAGFHDKNYLGDVLEWLYQDAGEAEKDENNPTRVQLRNDMAEAMRKIRALLGNN